MLSKAQVLEIIKSVGVVPVIRAESAEQALTIGDAVRAGGINILEFTMTVPGAIEVIREVTSKYGDEVVVGAGTVLDAETARAALLAGAEFIVGPGTDPATIALCRRYSKVVCPGALTPTEVINAWQMGADIVKIFPCGNVGGAKYIKGLKGPLPQIEMMPTGGVNLDTAADFIKAGCCALAAGAALVDKKAVSEGRLEVVTENAKKFVEIVKEARG